MLFTNTESPGDLFCTYQSSPIEELLWFTLLLIGSWILWFHFSEDSLQILPCRYFAEADIEAKLIYHINACRRWHVTSGFDFNSIFNPIFLFYDLLSNCCLVTATFLVFEHYGAPPDHTQHISCSHALYLSQLHICGGWIYLNHSPGFMNRSVGRCAEHVVCIICSGCGDMRVVRFCVGLSIWSTYCIHTRYLDLWRDSGTMRAYVLWFADSPGPADYHSGTRIFRRPQSKASCNGWRSVGIGHSSVQTRVCYRRWWPFCMCPILHFSCE